MKKPIKKSKENVKTKPSHLRTKPVASDGDYEMEGDAIDVQTMAERVSSKAQKMLNPLNKPDIQFDEKWKYYKGSKSERNISKEQFLRDGGTFEYISWSDYAGGNRLEISGEIIKKTRIWVFSGYGRFS